MCTHATGVPKIYLQDNNTAPTISYFYNLSLFLFDIKIIVQMNALLIYFNLTNI